MPAVCMPLSGLVLPQLKATHAALAARKQRLRSLIDDVEKQEARVKAALSSLSNSLYSS